MKMINDTTIRSEIHKTLFVDTKYAWLWRYVLSSNRNTVNMNHKAGLSVSVGVVALT